MTESTGKNKTSVKKENKKHKRRFRINKKLEGKTGIIYVGHDDPFLYFPDMMSYLSREEIDRIELKARGKSISNALMWLNNLKIDLVMKSQAKLTMLK